MSEDALLQIDLSAEMEEDAIRAVTSLNYSTTFVTDAVSAIERVLYLETKAARKVLETLICSNRVNALPEGPAVNTLEDLNASTWPPAKWFRVDVTAGDDLPDDLLEGVRRAVIPVTDRAKREGWKIRVIHWHEKEARKVGVHVTSPARKYIYGTFDETDLPLKLTEIFFSGK
jgi:hypothetical protein